MTTTIIILLVVFQVKHLLADYPLQTPYMLGKFKPGADYIPPLLAHVGVHALFTTIISLFFVHWCAAITLGVLDAVIHFGMDRIKASPNMLGRFKALSANEMRDLFAMSPTKHRSHDEFKFYLSRKESMLRSNKYFWWSLGLDQMVHHLTHYLIIYLLLLN